MSKLNGIRSTLASRDSKLAEKAAAKITEAKGGRKVVNTLDVAAFQSSI